MNRLQVMIGRPVQVAALLGIGIMIGTVAIPPSRAQIADPAAALAAQVAALAARVDALEAERDKQKPVKAPFTVTDGAGRAIFTVNATSSGAAVHVIGSGGSDVTLQTGSGSTDVFMSSGSDAASFGISDGSPLLRMVHGGQTLVAGSADGGMKLSVADGDARIEMVPQPGQPAVIVSSGEKAARVGSGAGSFGFVATTGGTPTASLSELGDGKYALRVYAAGGGLPILQAGYHTSGTPAISLWNGDDQIARLDLGEGGKGGKLTLFEGGNETVAAGSVQGSKGLVVSDGSAQVFAGMSTDEDPKLWIVKNKNILASLEAGDGENAGEVTVFRANDPRVRMSAGPAPGMRVLAGQEPVFSAYVGEDGIAGLGLYHDKNPVAQLGASTDSPGVGNLALFKQNRPAIELGDLLDGSIGLQVFDKSDDPDLSLAVAGNQPGLFVNKDGKLRAFVGMESGGNPALAIFSEEGRIGEMTAEGQSGALALLESGKPTITLGPTKEKPVPAFRAYNNGKVLLAAGATPAGTGLVAVYGGDDNIGAGLQGYSGGGGDVFASAGGKDLVTLQGRSSGGSMVVYGKAGTPLARLVDNGNGGSMVISDSGGSDVLEARSDPSVGGIVCVNYKNVEKCLGRGLTGMEGFH
jgi:hypothetical protein